MESVASNDRDVRLRFMQIDDRAIAVLREVWATIEPELPSVLDGFYNHVGSVEELSKLVGTQTPRLKQAQSAHWQRLFAGRFDDAYFNGVRTIGLTHSRIGLKPRWYMGGYLYVLNRLVAIIVARHRWSPARLPATLSAVNAVVMLDMELAISVYQDALLEDQSRRQKELEGTIREFETSVEGVVRTLSSSSSGLETTAKAMTATAERTEAQAAAVAAAAEQASANVQTVATAAEELSSSIAEIGRQVSDSTRITDQAVRETERTNAQVKGLAEAAQRIGDVVKLINDIAGQTNLLALNATIEAARAGEAGKGFAVVASEVKSLATQTAKATEDIAAQVKAIQSATGDSVQAIASITATIGRVNEIATTIAAAVEEQGAATKEIARNVQQASAGTTEVSTNIAGVTQSARDTGAATSQLDAAASELGRQAENLRSHVNAFLNKAGAA